MHIHYLEVITNAIDQTCKLYTTLHQVEFGDAVAELGQARTAQLANGSIIGIRAPMHAEEKPAIRPYWLVDNAQLALDRVVSKGATIAHPVLEISGYGRFALYTLGGVMQGLWQL